MLRDPFALRVFEVLLRIDLDVTAWRVEMCETRTLFDHVLEQEDLIRVLEVSSVAPRFACELALAALVVRAKLVSTGRRELRDTNVLAIGFCFWDLAIDARHM